MKLCEVMDTVRSTRNHDAGVFATYASEDNRPGMAYSRGRQLLADDILALLAQVEAPPSNGNGHKARAKTYSGGASIDVDWVDGPTAAAVDKVIGAFEAARFDGMQDLAYSADHWLTPNGEATVHKEYHNLDHFEPTPAPPGARLVRFGAHYVHGNRTITAPVLRQAALTVCTRYGMLPPPEVIESEPWGRCTSHAYLAEDNRRIGGGMGEWLTTLINREANAIDCYAAPTPPMGKDMRKALKKGDTYRRMDACQGGWPTPDPAAQVLMEGAC